MSERSPTSPAEPAIDLDESDVRRIAELARLHLADDEVAAFASQFHAILARLEEIEAVDTDGVPPLDHPLPLTNVLRPDEPRRGLVRGDALAGAPESSDGYFVVPRVMSEDA